MIFRWLLLISFCVATSLPPPAVAATYAPGPGAHAVAVWRSEWHDAHRDRTIPVKIHYPSDNEGAPWPVILFSHGLGGTREIYAYLGDYWAAHGYISVHLQHPGSDADVMAGTRRPLQKLRRLKAAANDPDNFVNRPRDVSFVVDELARRQDDPGFPLHGCMNLARVAVAGHSFGAYTVLAVAGQAIGPDDALRYHGPDPRIKAGIAMSSDAALTTNLDDAYARIRMPIFHFTGTKDQLGNGHAAGPGALIGNTTAAERRVAYDHTRQAPAWLLTLKDADHRVFAGVRGKRGDGSHDRAYQQIVCVASTAFWDAILKDNAAARHWLEAGGFTVLLGDSGVFEFKRP